MAAPWLSVVIPTRDSRKLTVRCAASLLGAAGEDLEIFVVDDASGDGTGDAVRRLHPSLQVLRLERPHGFSAAANLGLDRAKGEVLLLLNSDTEVDAAGLDHLRQAFTRRPRLGIAGGALRYPDGTPQWSGGAAPSLLWFFALASGLPAVLSHLPGYRRVHPLAGRRRVAWVAGAAFALRREVWRDHGPFDLGFRFYGQDLDLCLRAGETGWEVAVLPGFRVLHHHGATISHLARGTAARQHPELLWTDLLYWAEKRRGRRWAQRATVLLRLGGRWRLFGRRLRAPFVPEAERPAWSRDTAAFRRALAALGGPAR